MGAENASRHPLDAMVGGTVLTKVTKGTALHVGLWVAVINS